MGLFEKTNPLATRGSVVQEAKLFGALAGIAYCAVCIWYPDWRDLWWLKLPAAVAFGAGMGALIEWQVDDNIDIHWIVLEVEDEFGIEIADADWLEIDAVEDLFKCVLEGAKRTATDSLTERVANEGEIWGRLKALLVKQIGLKPEQVVKTARFCPELGVVTYPKRTAINYVGNLPARPKAF